MANFVLSKSDEAEASSMPDFQAEKIDPNDYTARARAIMAAYGYRGGEETLDKRLETIIVARLRDVRDDLETRENLTKSKKIGGMEFTSEQTDKLLKIIKNAGIGTGVNSEEIGNNLPTGQAGKLEIGEIQSAKMQNQMSSRGSSASGGTTVGIPSNKEQNVRENTKAFAPGGQGSGKPLRPSGTSPWQGEENSNAPVMPSKKAAVPPAPAPIAPPASIAAPTPKEMVPTIVMEAGLPVIKLPQDRNFPPMPEGGIKGGWEKESTKALNHESTESTKAQKQENKIFPPYQGGARGGWPEDSEDLGKPLPTSPWKGEEKGSGKPQPVNLSAADNNVKIKAAAVANISRPTIVQEEKKLPPARPEPYIASAKIPEKVLNVPAGRRPTLDDVKFIRKTMGPVEELAALTLIEFRRLSPDPREAVKKIKVKIELLEKEQFSKRYEGIAAWHKNEISRFYRLLGQASLGAGQSVEAVIKDRLLSGKPTLTIEEFNAVMELNKGLRY